MRLPAALPGRSLEAGGNAGPRGMFATAGKATTRRDRTRLTGRLWPFFSASRFWTGVYRNPSRGYVAPSRASVAEGACPSQRSSTVE